jgi:hypothetical protein
MNEESIATLNRASGILEGLSVSGDLSECIINMIIAVSEMIDEVLKKEQKL